jgi:type II secretory pathway predicted ATPase ExeA
VRVGLLSNAQQDFGELLQWVLMAFGLDFAGKSKVELFDTFQKFLIAEYGKGRHTILIIDEAQNLTPQTLEELRMLSNINADKDQLLQLILVGQPRLRSLLRRHDLLQLSQRVSADFHLSPLGLRETIDYVHHRTRHAGRERPVFTDEACALLHRVSRGVPRLINIIADTALVYGYADAAPVIDKQLVYAVVKDKAKQGSLQLSHLIKRKPKTAAPDSGRGKEGAAAAVPGPSAAERGGSAAARPGAAVVEFDKDAVRPTLVKRES